MTKFFNLRNVAKMLVACLAATMMFTACGDDDKDPKDPNNPPGSTTDTGWPPVAKLAEYNLGGWTQPAGISGIQWVETTNGNQQTGYFYTLGITFTAATVETKNTMDDFLKSWTSPELITWTETGPEVFEVTYLKYVGEVQYSVYATFNTVNGGSGSFSLRRVSITDNPGDDPTNPFEDEYTDAAFPALTGATDFIGTWTGGSYSLQLANTGTWSLKMMGVTAATGRFLVQGNTAYFYWHETEDGAPYYYFNGYAVRSGSTLEMHGGLSYTGGESWTKQ